MIQSLDIKMKNNIIIILPVTITIIIIKITINLKKNLKKQWMRETIRLNQLKKILTTNLMQLKIISNFNNNKIKTFRISNLKILI